MSPLWRDAVEELLEGVDPSIAPAILQREIGVDVKSI